LAKVSGKKSVKRWRGGSAVIVPLRTEELYVGAVVKVAITIIWQPAVVAHPLSVVVVRY